MRQESIEDVSSALSHIGVKKMGYKSGRCEDCECWIRFGTESSLRESLEKIYGSKALGANYCVVCASCFVQREIASGYRTPEGSLRTFES